MTNTTHFSLPKPDTTASVADEFYRLINTLDQIDAILKQIADAVAAKAAANHTHAMEVIPGLVAALSSKMEATRTFALGELRDVSGAADAASGYILAKTALGFAFQSAAALLGSHQHGVADIVGLAASIDAKIAALVASSPATLDTLAELAAALGNDPYFATTIAAQIADAARLKTGTVPDERLPARLRAQASVNVAADANLCTESGWYALESSALNLPGTQGGYIRTIAKHADWWVQEFFVQDGDSAAQAMYRRIRTGAVIGNWSRIYGTEAEIRGVSKMVSLPAVPATGAAIDWTSIPSDVEEIELWFDRVSITGISGLLVRVGTGGVPTTSGYVSGSGLAGGNARQSSTVGFAVRFDTAAYVKTGSLSLKRVAGQRWRSDHMLADEIIGYASVGGGAVTLAGTLDNVRLTTVNGTDNFDSGTVQMRYRR